MSLNTQHLRPLTETGVLGHLTAIVQDLAMEEYRCQVAVATNLNLRMGAGFALDPDINSAVVTHKAAHRKDGEEVNRTSALSSVPLTMVSSSLD